VTADEVISLLHLKPHPEGGFYCETFRDLNGAGGRAHSTAIYYLVRRRTIALAPRRCG
jgi:predicted cupin superfamily sugar epimerase